MLPKTTTKKEQQMTISKRSDRDAYIIYYTDASGTKRRKSAKTLADAEAFVKERDKASKQIGAAFADVNPEDRTMLKLALEKSRTHGFNVLDACEFYISNNGTQADMKLMDCHDLFAGEWEAMNHRKASDTQLQTSLAFCKAHEGHTVRSVEKEHVLAFIKGRKLSLRTMINYRLRIGKFFNWACDRGYRPDNPAYAIRHNKNGTELGFETKGRPSVFSVDEVKRLFRAAEASHRDLIPYLTLGIFAGVRPLEISHNREKTGLGWGNIFFKQQAIEIPAPLSKTRECRDITIHPNMMDWFGLGGLLPISEYTALCMRRQVAKEAGVSWEPDIMRHTYATMHLKHFRNEALLKEEMGHSYGSRTLKNNYINRKDVDAEDAAAFWNLVPVKNC